MHYMLYGSHAPPSALIGYKLSVFLNLAVCMISSWQLHQCDLAVVVYGCRYGKSILQVPDTGTRVLNNTRLFLRSSIVSF